MLKQHKYYVYHSGGTVFARMDDRAPVVIKEYDTPQEAHDAVQEIVNPGKRKAESYGQMGFNSDEFQEQISPNCERVVLAAYGEGGEV